MASVFGLPGILEIITAFGLALDPDPLVNSMDSVYWWFLGITSVWVGWTMLCQQHKLMQMAPWPFLICLPILNLHYYFILRVEGPKVPYGHSMLLGFWFVFSALRQYHLHRSFQEMHEVCASSHVNSCTRQHGELGVREGGRKRETGRDNCMHVRTYEDVSFPHTKLLTEHVW